MQKENKPKTETNDKGTKYSGLGYKSPYLDKNGYFAFPIQLIKLENSCKHNQKKDSDDKNEDY